MKQQRWQVAFFTLWTGQAFSQVSSSVLQFAIVWYLNAKTGSVWVLSLAMLATFLPSAVLGTFIGVLIDRYDRKKLMIFSDLFIALVSCILIVAEQLTGTLPNGIIYLVLILRSIGSTIHEPTLQAVTPQIVPADQITRCAGYSQTLESVSQIISPAVAAILFGFWSLPQIILLDVVGAVIAMVAAALCKIPPLSHTRNKQLFSFFEETKSGWRVLAGQKGLLGLTFVSAAYSLAMMPVSAYFPWMSTHYFGSTEKGAGLVELVFAIGLFVGALVLSTLPNQGNKIKRILFSCILMFLCLFVIGVLRPTQFLWFNIIAFFMGIAGPFFWGMFNALLQENFSHNVLGRVLATTRSITVIASPIGMLISGQFAKHFGAQPWFIVAGMIILLLTLVCWLKPDIRRCDLQYYRRKGDMKP